MTRYVIDARTLLHVVAHDVVVNAGHQLVAPTMIRSQALALLLDAVRADEMSEPEALGHHERLTELKMRLLSDRVSRRTAWKIAASTAGRPRWMRSTSQCAGCKPMHLSRWTKRSPPWHPASCRSLRLKLSPTRDCDPAFGGSCRSNDLRRSPLAERAPTRHSALAVYLLALGSVHSPSMRWALWDTDAAGADRSPIASWVSLHGGRRLAHSANVNILENGSPVSDTVPNTAGDPDPRGWWTWLPAHWQRCCRSETP